MAFQYADRVDNVFLLDTNFFGFPCFNSAYVVKGDKKTALIDTGDSNQLEAVRREMDRVGVTMKDVDYIFVTHCEHNDHAGNAGTFASENPDVKVCINPIGEEYLTRPDLEDANRRRMLPEGMADRFGKMLPVDPKQLYMLKDGEEFDLGGDTLKVVFAPGHQPSGYVIEESKNNMLFINDICGQYFEELGVALILTPARSSPVIARDYMQTIGADQFQWLAMGHYGFSSNPNMVIQGACSRISRLMSLAEKCDAEGRLDDLWQMIMDQVLVPEMDKIRRIREESFYIYYLEHLGPNLCNGFTQYYAKYREEK